ncbi:MAG: hypothetical protein DMF67_00705 [Acidobacteria bacterium]|nr:MAG: hypothetical protein DMF66_04065 [Acidobacteriota bacterium]PYS85504.1 MAG: hypothetical protein DMF67_00705 [Acidobacteriota bacterium]
MIEKTEILSPQQLSEVEGQEAVPATPAARKPFVEPEVSFPIDVLEATTFFQGTDSGVLAP